MLAFISIVLANWKVVLVLFDILKFKVVLESKKYKEDPSPIFYSLGKAFLIPKSIQNPIPPISKNLSSDMAIKTD